MATDLISLAEAEEAVRAGGTAPAAVLTQLPKFVTAASSLIQSPDLAGPIVYEERTATFDGGRAAYVLPVAPATATAVTVDGTALATSSWTADTGAGIVRSEVGSFASGYQNVVVTYAVGSMDPVPDHIKLACMDLVAHLWQTSRQAARMGTDSVVPMGFAVPNRIRDLCRPEHKALGFA